MSITDVVNSIPALTDIGIPIIAIIVIAWLAEKNSSKQQEATMLHNEQMDKTFKIIANFTENLSELVALIREGNEKTDNTSDKVDEVSRKMDEVNRKLENIKEKTEHELYEHHETKNHEEVKEKGDGKDS